MVDEVGVEPGSELRELHEAILRQDPALEPPASVPRPHGMQRGPRRRPRVARARSRTPRLLIGAAAVVAVALGTFGLLSDDDGESVTVAENAVGVIDVESGEVRSQIAVGQGPGPSATDGQAVWIANVLDDTVSRIDTESGRLSTIDIGGEPGGIATGSDFVWVSDSTAGTVDQLDPEASRVVGSLEVGNGAGGVAVAFDAVWVLAAGDGEVVKIDLARGEVTARIPVGARPTAIVAGAGSLWVADEGAGTIARVEPETERVSEAIAVGNAPAGLAVRRRGRSGSRTGSMAPCRGSIPRPTRSRAPCRWAPSRPESPPTAAGCGWRTPGMAPSPASARIRGRLTRRSRSAAAPAA